MSIFALLIAAIGLFLSLWIVVPGPNMALVRLSIGAPEISPWLMGVNGIAVLLALWLGRSQGAGRAAIVCGVVGLVFSSWPLLQVPSTHQRFAMAMEAGLGRDYLAQVRPEQLAQMRSSPFALRDSLVGMPRSPVAVRYTPDIQFAAPDGVPLKLDVYLPPAIGKHPTLVMIHGGGWQGGSRREYAEFNTYMAARGYTVIAIAYRFAPRYQFPAQLEDVQSALNFIQAHAAEYEVDLQRVMLMGRSAGAHLALLAAYQPQAMPIRGVISYYGPTNLVEGYADPPNPDPINTRDLLEKFLGGAPDRLLPLYQQASPLYVEASSFPPTLLIYGKRDHIVKAEFGHQLFECSVA
jgi:acetyl esterase/lipase